MMNYDTLLRCNVRAELARRNYIDFVTYIKPDYQVKWFHDYLAKQLTLFEKGKIKKLMVLMPPQHGKQISDTVPVLCVDGWKTHGDLKQGDFVFGRDGAPVKVLAISDKTQSEYEITFTDGSVIECHGNHEWVVYDRSRRQERKVNANYLSSQKIWSGEGRKRGNRTRFQVDSNKPITTPEQYLPVHPYVLGAWLGDGSAGKNCITHHPNDIQTVEKIVSCGYPISSSWAHKKTRIITTSFVGISTDLRRAGCYNDKHIPEVYFISSINQRLELLAGLIDTDGYVYHKNGRVTFSNVNKRLVEDVRKIVVSLGWRVSISEFEPSISTSGIQGRQIVYQLCFNPNKDIPTAISRKRLSNYSPTERRRGIVSVIKKEGLGWGNCIQVEGGVYLVGDTLIPTHNSELTTRKFPAYLMGKNPDRLLAVVSYNNVMSNGFNRAIQRGLDCPEFIATFPETLINYSNYHSVLEPGKVRNTDRIDILKHKGSIITIGVGGTLTGNPVDIGIIDDPYKDREQARSEAYKQYLREWYVDVYRTRLHNESQELLIMTSWDEDDLCQWLLRKENDWTVIKFPAIKENEECEYDPREVGEALWPEKHSLERLLAVKEKSQVTFNALYQQDPKPNTDVLIFGNWQECDSLPDGKYFWGCDFGYTNDPTAITKCVRKDDKIFIKECLYTPCGDEHGIKAVLMANGYNNEPVYCDHDKELIAALRRVGVSAFPANKSIAAGIAKVNSFRVFFTKDSDNIRMETRKYQYVTYGEVITNEPAEGYDHLCDSARYAIYTHYFHS